MTGLKAIARREVAGLFYSPIAYVAMTVFLLFLSFFFAAFIFAPGQLADMRTMFYLSRWALVIVIPLLTMGLMSDEYKSGRIEMLRTSPLTELELVLGKFIGASIFYIALLASTLIYLLLLSAFGRPDFGPVLASYLGLLLMGMMFIAIGLFFSTCTENQIIAAMGSMLTLVMLGILLGFFNGMAPEPFRSILRHAAVDTHLQDFTKGIIDTGHVAYFGLGTFLFLSLTYLVLETRKWR